MVYLTYNNPLSSFQMPCKKLSNNKTCGISEFHTGNFPCFCYMSLENTSENVIFGINSYYDPLHECNSFYANYLGLISPHCAWKIRQHMFLTCHLVRTYLQLIWHNALFWIHNKDRTVPIVPQLTQLPVIICQNSNTYEEYYDNGFTFSNPILIEINLTFVSLMVNRDISNSVFQMCSIILYVFIVTDYLRVYATVFLIACLSVTVSFTFMNSGSLDFRFHAQRRNMKICWNLLGVILGVLILLLVNDVCIEVHIVYCYDVTPFHIKKFSASASFNSTKL